MYELIIIKYNKYKEQYEKDQQTFKSFDKFYRTSLQDNVIDKSEYKCLYNIFDNYVDEMKNESFFIMNIKTELIFFTNDKFEFNLEPKT